METIEVLLLMLIMLCVVLVAKVLELQEMVMSLSTSHHVQAKCLVDYHTKWNDSLIDHYNYHMAISEGIFKYVKPSEIDSVRQSASN